MIPNMYGIKEMKVVKLIIMETGSYNPQYRRPYETALDASKQNIILDALDRSRSVTPTAVANVAGLFVKPQATPEAEIQIGGVAWQEKRMRFILEVSTLDRTGMMNVSEFIQGYTDYPGQSWGGALDPNMVLYVNSVQSTRTSIQATPLGTQTHHNLIDASHILVNNAYQGANSANQMYGLRPEDIYDQMDNRELGDTLNGNGWIMDGRTKITGNATKSRRSNSVAPVYMATVLDSYLQTARTQVNDPQQDILEIARHSVESDPITTDPFMAFVRSCSPMGGNGGSFRLGDLWRLDPNTPNVTEAKPLNQDMRANLVHPGMSNHWGGADYGTLWATTLAQSMPSYMTTFSISSIHLSCTNYDSAGNVTTKVGNVRTFNNNVDMTRETMALIFRMENEIIKNLSQNNAIGFAFEMKIDLMGDTKIELSLNGGPPVPYIMPTFCDALMAPVMTTNYNNLQGVSNDFGTLMLELYQHDAQQGSGAAMRTGII